ncbi:Speckle-type POZ protein B [Araneus ventricosus]|uniref:Speckle-type POZ protein B n=1 Tax=Araneus ventricosus TaxID=182803 RepID=A0A4Y2D8J9_ARAVE|nr:Speckle-type POZ protein B [Araneus ventricosus]
MACQNNTNRKEFTFIWILENFEYCWQKTGNSLKSPTFIVDTFERTKWSLSIKPRGYDSDRWISLYLRREEDSKGSATIELDYEIAFVASDGSELTSQSEYKHTFLKDGSWGFPKFEERETVFAKRSKFLPQGVLTMRCRMWMSKKKVKKDGLCIARTRIGVERQTFLWRIKKFSTFDVCREKTYRLKSTSDDKPIVSLNLCFSKNRSSHTIFIKFVNSNESIEFSTFQSSLVDAHGEYVNCGKQEFWFSPAIRGEECALSLSKDTLMDNKSLYLPKDALTLHCEYAFYTGVVFEGVEATNYGCSNSFITNNMVPENIKTASGEKSNSDTSDLKTDLSSLQKENILCDVKLCTDSEAFPAHWIILSARSPVFRAMFKSDMKKKAKDRIVIEDLKPDIVRRMLLYMYTDSLEELQWQTASDLYVAAGKYQIMSLKNKCTSFLKTNLSLSNACKVLLLADLHQDKEIKSAAQDFILENDKSIINSIEWKLLMEANVSLAAETMLLRYKE